MIAELAQALEPGQQVRTTKLLTGYYYDESPDGIDCVYLGTIGRVVQVPTADAGQTVIVDFGDRGQWPCWSHEIEAL